MRDRVTKILNQAAQSDLAARIARSDALVQAVTKAFEVSSEARQMAERQFETIAARMGFAKQEEVDALRAELAGLRAEVARLARAAKSDA